MPNSICHRPEPPTSKDAKVIWMEAQRRLWEGVEENDELLIEEAFLSGADLEELRDDSWTPLTEAASEGRVDAVKALIRLGVGLERRGAGWTALNWASNIGHEGVVSQLLAAGADVVTKTGSELTPLHLASYWGHLTTASLLLEAGAELNAQDSDGNTPLSLAVSSGHTIMSEYLRSLGAQT